MPRAARPSDLYRLPTATVEAEPSVPAPTGERRRRGPRRAGLVSLLVVALVTAAVASGLGAREDRRPAETEPVTARGTDVPIGPARAPGEIVALFAAEAEAVADISAHRDVFAGRGPAALLETVFAHSEHILRHLDHAYPLAERDLLARRYLYDRGHIRLIEHLKAAEQIVRDIALRELAHQGPGRGVASAESTAAVGTVGELAARQSVPPGLVRWARAVSGQARVRRDPWVEGTRRDAARDWRRVVVTLPRPAARDALRRYVHSLAAADLVELYSVEYFATALRRLVGGDRFHPPRYGERIFQ